MLDTLNDAFIRCSSVLSGGSSLTPNCYCSDTGREGGGNFKLSYCLVMAAYHALVVLSYSTMVYHISLRCNKYCSLIDRLDLHEDDCSWQVPLSIVFRNPPRPAIGNQSLASPQKWNTPVPLTLIFPRLCNKVRIMVLTERRPDQTGRPLRRRIRSQLHLRLNFTWVSSTCQRGPACGHESMTALLQAQPCKQL